MSFSVLRGRKKMAKFKDYHWVPEDRKEFTRWNEETLFSKLGIQSRRVLFRIPRNRVLESDGGDSNDSIQIFESNNLPEYVEGTIEGLLRISAKRRIVISLQPLEFKDGAQLELRGANGWKAGTAILNHFCRVLCDQEGVVSARSIMLSDLIGTDWKGSLNYTFGNQQYSIEKFLNTREPEAPRIIKNYPTWKKQNIWESGPEAEHLQEEVTLKSMNFWLATRVVMPTKNAGGQEGLVYSIAYYENGHSCMDKGLFGTNGQEKKRQNCVRPVIILKQPALHDPEGPIIIPD